MTDRPAAAAGGPRWRRGPKPDRITAFFKLLGALWIEACMLALLYGMYAETLGLASSIGLGDLPVAGLFFEWLDPEATVSHLLTFCWWCSRSRCRF